MSKTPTSSAIAHAKKRKINIREGKCQWNCGRKARIKSNGKRASLCQTCADRQKKAYQRDKKAA